MFGVPIFFDKGLRVSMEPGCQVARFSITKFPDTSIQRRESAELPPRSGPTGPTLVKQYKVHQELSPPPQPESKDSSFNLVSDGYITYFYYCILFMLDKISVTVAAYVEQLCQSYDRADTADRDRNIYGPNVNMRMARSRGALVFRALLGLFFLTCKS